MPEREIRIPPTTTRFDFPGFNGRQLFLQDSPNPDINERFRNQVLAAVRDRTGLIALNDLGERAIADGGLTAKQTLLSATADFVKRLDGLRTNPTTGIDQQRRANAARRAKLYTPAPAADASEVLIDQEIRQWLGVDIGKLDTSTVEPVVMQLGAPPTLTATELQRVLLAAARAPVPSIVKTEALRRLAPQVEAENASAIAELTMLEAQVAWASTMIGQMLAVADPTMAAARIRQAQLSPGVPVNSLAQAAD